METAPVVRGVTFCETHIRTNKEKKGCRANTHAAVQFAHDLGSDFNVYVEDDIIVSRDALTLADAFHDSRESGVLVMRRWHTTQELDKPDIVKPDFHGLLGNGFAWNRDMHSFLTGHWFVNTPKLPMWDWSVDAGLANARVLCWRPMVNRTTSIGVHGTHCTNSLDQNLFGPMYEGEPVTQFKFQL